MNPLLDQLAVIAALIGAVAFFVVRLVRKHKAGKNCGGDCGCGTSHKDPRRL